MNRIYQGRVTQVQKRAQGTPNEWENLPDGEFLLWRHHELFQDAVNYYIFALASLGVSPDSKLTKLRELLGKVWEDFNKNGQSRQGMRHSMQRAWQLAEPPSLDYAIKRFQDSLLANNVQPATAEKAAGYLLSKLGGDSSIQQGGPDFLPMFCDVDSKSTFKLSGLRRGRAEDEARLKSQLHTELTDKEIVALARSITLGSVVNLQPNGSADVGEGAVQRLRVAATTFSKEITSELFGEWLRGLDPAFSLPKRRGGNINVKRVDACALFLAFPNPTTKKIFQMTFTPPRSRVVDTKDFDSDEEKVSETRFIVDGHDPIELSRGKRGYVFAGFTTLPLWQGDGRKLFWKKFDIASFKEALKVYNQFQQNVKKREDKLNHFATKLLIMDGERAMKDYAEAAGEVVRRRLEKIWRDTKGKPLTSRNEAGEDHAIFRFTDDLRIDRLRKIINDDLAEEYRLTDGRKTAYGLRRRTMKGWEDVKRKWRTIVKQDVPFSDTKRTQLKAALDEMRTGEKREKIGSHKLFEALIVDEPAWNIWREPDDKLQEQIIKQEWADDPLEAFREYCEIRDALEEASARDLNFTPADARFSRRLFMFKDVCSFKGCGDYKHDLSEQAVTVPIAVCGADGRFAVQASRLCYSAPRLLRDQIRGEDGSYVQDWTQPMMQALFGKREGKINPQELKEAAVQLMPDYNGSGGQRVLLNFPLTLDDSKIQEHLGKADIWQKQFVPWKRGTQFPFMRWADDFDGKESHHWWDKVYSFRVLAADLGTRHVAGVALVEFGHEKGGTARFIGSTGGKDWFGRFRSGAVLRLPGEDAVVLRPESPLDKDGRGKAFRTECYGERGRPADDAECCETFAILAELNQSDLLDGISEAAILKQRFSFSELNDKLLVAARRAQGWIAVCISWHWKLSNPDSEEQRQSALEQLREQVRLPEWKVLADGDEGNLVKLRDALHIHISAQRQLVQKHLLQLTSRVIPLLGRRWEWVKHPDKEDCHLLRQTVLGSEGRKTKLRGQRGLSMIRIEQLSELRRRWQSLNQSLRRQIGEKPPTASQMRNDPIPDPCPDVLRKLDNIREQRVNQTAHLILTQALGLKLRKPKKSAKSREITDTHGEYEVARPPVDFIVLENLSRYLTYQGRAKSENTRLMKWCHRAVMLKVKMLAEPYGIPVLETPAAYSSRFCSLTGMAGFRAGEVGWEHRYKFRWRVLLNEVAKAKEENKTPSENASQADAMFAKLKKISCSDHPHRTLIAPQPGGPMFVTALAVAHPAPAKNRKQKDKSVVLPMQADLNAAINLAFRAVAHPDCAGIHHRLRTERKKGAKNQPDTFLTREKRRFPKKQLTVILREGDTLPKEGKPNLFYDDPPVAMSGRARLETDNASRYSYASGPGLWKTVNDRIAQWRRCADINNERMRFWNVDPEDEIPMT